MIHVRLEQKSENLLIEARGHALFAADGTDIVCAAVSVLIQNWQLSCNKLGKGVHVKTFTKGEFSAETEESPVHLLLWKSLALGLQALEAKYPENMKIILEESNGS